MIDGNNGDRGTQQPVVAIAVGGRLDGKLHEQELARLRELLRGSGEAHHRQFLQAWEARG